MSGLSVDHGHGNMEGKETRFGVANSALFATVTTGTSCGAVNSMHDSFNPMGGIVPLVNIQLGEVCLRRRGRRALRHPDVRAPVGLHRRA
jgi:K+-transporting ATPase ATPase A chain